MFKSIITPALVAVAFAGSAFADNSQSAALAGVSAGEYTAAELQHILDARQDGDTARLEYFLTQTNRESAGVADKLADGQLAALAGVPAGEYTRFEALQIISAREDGDANRLDYYLSQENRKEAADASVVTPIEARIAARLGVDPADYTLAELYTLESANDAD